MYHKFKIASTPLVHGMGDGLDVSHPYVYDTVCDDTHRVSLLSPRDDLEIGREIYLNAAPTAAGSPPHHYWIEDASHAAARQIMQPVVVQDGEIHSDVIMTIDVIGGSNHSRPFVAGKILYVDPAMKGLENGTLRAAFKAGATIRVETKTNPYFFNVGYTRTFQELEAIRVNGGQISAREVRACNHP